jgi:RNA methyltransferase, TrmH family
MFNPLSAREEKLIRLLHQSKQRQKYCKFLAEGDKIVVEALTMATKDIYLIAALPEWLDLHESMLRDLRVDSAELSVSQLKELSQLQTPNQVIMVMHQPEPLPIAQDGWILYADGIRDPGNLGTIWRIADWFGCKALVCRPDSVDPHNAKVIQASMGAFLRIPVFEMELKQLKEQVNLPIYGAVLHGDPINKTVPRTDGILVVGSESHGIHDDHLAILDYLVTIPGGGGAESLNASVATGILCSWLMNND